MTKIEKLKTTKKDYPTWDGEKFEQEWYPSRQETHDKINEIIDVVN